MKARLVAAGAIGLFLSVLVVGSTTGMPLIPHLLFGWVGFLGRVVPRVHVSADGVATAAVCLTLATFGFHRFAAWLTREVARARATTTRWRVRWTAAFLGLFVLMFAAGIAATGVFHQAGWLLRPREAPLALEFDQRFRTDWNSSQSHLYHIGMDLAGATNEPSFPWGKTDAHGRVLHSWMTHSLLDGHIVSWLPSGPIDRDKPWDDPRNSAYFRGIVVPYLNMDIAQIRDERGYALSHYAGNVHTLGGTSPGLLNFFNHAAGASQTIAAGQVAARFRAWGDPENLRDPAIGVNSSEAGFGGPSGEGALFLFFDGSVRFVTRTADPAVLRALSGAGTRP
jgi:hypothetical protein